MRLCRARQRAAELGLVVLKHHESLRLTNQGTQKSLDETDLPTLIELETELSRRELVQERIEKC